MEKPRSIPKNWPGTQSLLQSTSIPAAPLPDTINSTSTTALTSKPASSHQLSPAIRASQPNHPSSTMHIPTLTSTLLLLSVSVLSHSLALSSGRLTWRQKVLLLHQHQQQRFSRAADECSISRQLILNMQVQ